MSRETKSIRGVAAAVYAHLRERGIESVVVGGSAISLHVPHVYTSRDLDLAIVSGLNRQKVAKALEELGFSEHGRDFVHPQYAYTVDLVAETPYIDRRPIIDFCTIETPSGIVRTYYLEDAIADRIAAWLHWSDSQSLQVAEKAAAAGRDTISIERLNAALDALEVVDRPSHSRAQVARERLRRALES